MYCSPESNACPAHMNHQGCFLVLFANKQIMLRPCYSKCGLRDQQHGYHWGAGYANFWILPQTQLKCNEILHLTHKILQSFWYTLKFEKHLKFTLLTAFICLTIVFGKEKKKQTMAALPLSYCLWNLSQWGSFCFSLCIVANNKECFSSKSMVPGGSWMRALQHGYRKPDISLISSELKYSLKQTASA